MGELTPSLGESDCLILGIHFQRHTWRQKKRGSCWSQEGKYRKQEGSGHTAVYAVTQYGWLWATGKKFNNSKIPYAEHEVEEKSSKQGLRQLYPTSAQNTHFSQGFTNYFLGEIQKWLNFEMWILLFLNFLIRRTVKLFLERSSWNWTSQAEVVCSEGCPDHVCLPQPTSPSLSFLWKVRTLRKKEICILVYSLALIHSFNNAMINYIPSYKVNSPIFTVSYCPFFPSM